MEGFNVMNKEYRYYINNKSEIIIELQDNVFAPTGTSEELIKVVSGYLKKKGSLLDLGCGSGIVGFVLHRMGKVSSKIHASDICSHAVELVNINAKKNNIKCDAREGAIFSPWKGQKFDYIIDDISGISQEIADISPWFKKTMCDTGVDGADLVVDAIKQAPSHLNDGGKFFFPVLSLSNVDRIISCATDAFKHVEKLSNKVWQLPNEMKPHMEKLNKLYEKGYINYEEKFGLILWYTDIYVAYND
jgi:SAM-dependent methyltransferase